MGLFENLGRKVESFKQRAESAAEESTRRECADCGEPVHADRSECPSCGGDPVVVEAEDTDSA